MMDLNLLPEDILSDDGYPVSDSDLLCSICLDPASRNVERTVVELKCKHKFHLDCIGSAFNAKLEMVCPNCRNLEVGDWQFPSGYVPIPDAADDIWYYEDVEHAEMVDPHYVPEMQAVTIHWCPVEDVAPSPTHLIEANVVSSSNTHAPVHQWLGPYAQDEVQVHAPAFGHAHEEIGALHVSPYFDFVLPGAHSVLHQEHYYQEPPYTAPPPDHRAHNFLDLLGSGTSGRQ